VLHSNNLYFTLTAAAYLDMLDPVNHISMNTIITSAQIISAIILMAVILLQNRGASLGGIFGGSNAVFRTKRGVEKTLFTLSIVFSIMFLGLSLANIIL